MAPFRSTSADPIPSLMQGYRLPPAFHELYPLSLPAAPSTAGPTSLSPRPLPEGLRGASIRFVSSFQLLDSALLHTKGYADLSLCFLPRSGKSFLAWTLLAHAPAALSSMRPNDTCRIPSLSLESDSVTAGYPLASFCFCPFSFLLHLFFMGALASLFYLSPPLRTHTHTIHPAYFLPLCCPFLCNPSISSLLLLHLLPDRPTLLALLRRRRHGRRRRRRRSGVLDPQLHDRLPRRHREGVVLPRDASEDGSGKRGERPSLPGSVPVECDGERAEESAEESEEGRVDEGALEGGLEAANRSQQIEKRG